MTNKRECEMTFSVLEKTYGLDFEDLVVVKVRAMNDIGWGPYSNPNTDGFRMEREP
jgi:hypothetical protein